MAAAENRHGREASGSDQSWHSGSDCNLSDVDLEYGDFETKMYRNDDKAERDCRICQLDLEGEERECGVPIELGCSCKGDLGSAHKQCAETWFKIKGDTTCEICGVIAVNIGAHERTSEPNLVAAQSATSAGPVILVETMWHGRRIVNFLFACMVLAFITSWLFHFKIL